MVYGRRKRFGRRRRSRKAGYKAMRGYRRYKAKRWHRRLKSRKRGGKFNTNRISKDVLICTKGIKHNLGVHRARALLRTQYNSCLSRWDLTDSGSYLAYFWAGYPYLHDNLVWKMNSIWDPSRAVLNRWQTSAGYHKILSETYQEYRVLSSKITISLSNIGGDYPVLINGGSLTFNEKQKCSYYEPWIVSLIKDDNGNLPLHTDKMMQWPAQRFQDRVKQMRFAPDINNPSTATMKWYWALDYNTKKDGTSWAAIGADPPAQKGSLPYFVLALQRESYNAMDLSGMLIPPALPAITLRTKITYLVEYRYPKDFTEAVWQAHDVGSPEPIPDTPVGEIEVITEVTPTPVPTPEEE